MCRVDPGHYREIDAYTRMDSLQGARLDVVAHAADVDTSTAQASLPEPAAAVPGASTAQALPAGSR